MTCTPEISAFRPRSIRGLLCSVGVSPSPESQRGLQSADTTIWSYGKGCCRLWYSRSQKVLPPLVLPVTVGDFFGVDGAEVGSSKGVKKEQREVVVKKLREFIEGSQILQETRG